MAPLRRHRRNHSWPHCKCGSNSKLCTCEAQSLDLRTLMSKHASSSLRAPSLTFEQTTIRAPLFLEDMTDDVEMAGIDRTPPLSPRMHRVWSQEEPEPEDEIIISTIIPNPRKNARRNIFCRLIRRPLFKRTRSAVTSPTRKTGRRRIYRWILPRLSAKQTVVVTDLTWAALPTLHKADSTPNLVPELERPHRRTHSERPRSWAEPGAGLWTLEEEE
ncbi:hypothetical protein N7495_004388 [Penicillium taxi]|uniref:uncharacterized protein n=1 Tax=Penicillium taxi TaxID=168475 RepID=UPI0025453AAB|nr:uncharacterized protein N7495_004388 [Penicillium taxi]KAJ5899644.1 hypothetical protein N7495_004388 [Penicillium taxi]